MSERESNFEPPARGTIRAVIGSGGCAHERQLVEVIVVGAGMAGAAAAAVLARERAGASK